MTTPTSDIASDTIITASASGNDEFVTVDKKKSSRSHPSGCDRVYNGDYSISGSGLAYAQSFGSYPRAWDELDRFTPNLNVGDDCVENGLVSAVAGLYKTVLLTEDEFEVIKIWQTSENGSPEEFFVKTSLCGTIGLRMMIILSEVSLWWMDGKKIADLYDAKGLSKKFFKLIEFTDSFDDFVTDESFVRYWLERKQDLSAAHPDAAKLVSHMLKLVKAKRKLREDHQSVT